MLWKTDFVQQNRVGKVHSTCHLTSCSVIDLEIPECQYEHLNVQTVTPLSGHKTFFFFFLQTYKKKKILLIFETNRLLPGCLFSLSSRTQ